MPRLSGPLPLSALRDLIGICRALFASWRVERAGSSELEELAQIGAELRAAYEQARRTSPDTLGHRAAWSRAERAMLRLGSLIGELVPLKPVLTVAGARVTDAARRPEPSPVGAGVEERRARRMARRLRS